MTAFKIAPSATAFMATSRKTRRPRAAKPDHLAFIRSLPCLVTGQADSVEAAHVSFENLQLGKLGRGKGTKEDDCWTVPLSPREHWEQHRLGEREYWKQAGIDPCVIALALWRCSCFDDHETAVQVIRMARR